MKVSFVVPPEEARRGFALAVAIAALTAVTFALAILTPPVTGPLCTAGCLTYPYLEAAARFPRDYLWMFPAMALSPLLVALLAVIHRSAPPAVAAYSLTGLCLGVAGAMLLLADYYLQVAAVQPSLLQREAGGVAMLTQYNPHGVFIALEELGYLLVSLALLCLAPVLWGAGRLGRAAAWTFIAGSVLAAGALAGFAFAYGHQREYRLEIAVISIDWLALIAGAILLAVLYGRSRRPR